MLPLRSNANRNARTLTALLSVLALAVAGILATGPSASADDGDGGIVLGPAPEFRGVDSIVAAEAWDNGGAGEYSRTPAKVVQRLDAAGKRSKTLIDVCNRGGDLGRIRLHGTAGTQKFRARYFTKNGTDVTSAIVKGEFRTRVLKKEECASFTLVVRRTATARDGDARTFWVNASPAKRPKQFDRVGARIIAS